MTRRGRQIAAALVCACGLAGAWAGCSTMAPITQPVIRIEAKPPGRPVSPLVDIVGAIHIHTTFSDGAGTFEEIARIANAQRLDFLVVTDHNTLAPQHQGLHGWYGSTLVLIGTEISTSWGHYLALNVTDLPDRRRLSPQQIIDQVNTQGGFGFIAHPYGKPRWKRWPADGVTGLEIASAYHDALDEHRLRLAAWTIFTPQRMFYESLLDRPYDPLAQWDRQLASGRRLVGIGAGDAHEMRVGPMRFAPYDVLFRLVRTHLLVPERPRGERPDEDLYQALRNGHAYVAFELSDEARGFRFSLRQRGVPVAVMGDEVAFDADLSLSVELPLEGDMTLFRDGTAMDRFSGSAWQVPVHQPGIYRIEVTRRGRPWIYSNPIYVR